MVRPFAHPVACCWMLLLVVLQSLKPVKLFSQQLSTFLLFRDRRSVAQQCWIRLHMLLQHCWGHARSLCMVYKDLWVVSFPRCTAGPNIVGSCCIRLHTTANTHATTSNIVGATMLGPFAHSLRSLINPSSQVKDSSIMRVKIARILSFSWRRRTKKTLQSHTTRFAFVFVHLWLSYREKQIIPLY